MFRQFVSARTHRATTCLFAYVCVFICMQSIKSNQINQSIKSILFIYFANRMYKCVRDLDPAENAEISWRAGLKKCAGLHGKRVAEPLIVTYGILSMARNELMMKLSACSHTIK